MPFPMQRCSTASNQDAGNELPRLAARIENSDTPQAACISSDPSVVTISETVVMPPYDKLLVTAQDKNMRLRKKSCHPIKTSMGKPYQDIADRLKWHRSLLGLTQEEYAKKAGLKRAQLNNWEGGAHRIGLDGARALRKTYGLSLDFIYEGISDALDMTLRNELRDNPIVSESK